MTVHVSAILEEVLRINRGVRGGGHGFFFLPWAGGGGRASKYCKGKN